MTRHRTRVLFAPLADADIVTSQNLSARDIALHLDPVRHWEEVLRAVSP